MSKTKEITMKIYSPAELMALPKTDRIADLLRDAAKCLDAGNSESACWRLADAALLLHNRLTSRGCTDLCGFDVPTGRNALLNSENK
jgi:hypothetical protein